MTLHFIRDGFGAFESTYCVTLCAVHGGVGDETPSSVTGLPDVGEGTLSLRERGCAKVSFRGNDGGGELWSYETSEPCAGVGGCYEGFTDQDRVGSGGPDAVDVLPAAHAALADDDLAGRDGGRKALGDLQVGLEGTKVAVVDPDDLGVDLEGLLELGLVMHLDERLHPKLLREGAELSEQAGIEHRDYQEDRVSAVRPRLVEPGTGRRRTPCEGRECREG